MHFTLELADFTVSYTSLRIQNYSFLVGKIAKLQQRQGTAEYSDEGNISYIVKIWLLHALMQKNLMTMADLRAAGY